MVRRKATAKVQVPIRMVEALRAKLEKAAKARAVSLNSEIVQRLEQSFTQEVLTDAVLEKIRTEVRAPGFFGGNKPPRGVRALLEADEEDN